MAAKNWCFTINNPTVAEESNFNGNFELHKDIKYMVCQKEMGENETPHLQGYIQLVKKKRMNQVKEIVGQRAHVEISRGSVEDNKRYCTKEPRLEGPWEQGEASFAGKRNDLKDFVEDFKSRKIDEEELLTRYAGVIARYPRFVERVQRLRDRPAEVEFIPREGWQVDLSMVLLGPVDRRKVMWYWEAIGNSGKSYFGLNFKDSGGRFGYVVTGGRHGDIFYAYQNERVVFFDWARDLEEAFPYRVVEAFKNGYFLSTKYESVCRRFEVPHVVVFANFAPDRSKLSNDRWIIKEI